MTMHSPDIGVSCAAEIFQRAKARREWFRNPPRRPAPVVAVEPEPEPAPVPLPAALPDFDIALPPSFTFVGAITRVQRIVAAHYGITAQQMLHHARTMPLVRIRQVAFYLCRDLMQASLTEIGRRFKNRDHTTVLHACRKIERLIADSPEYAEEIASLRLACVASLQPRDSA